MTEGQAQYKPGDVVNGHRLSADGTRWEPLPPPPPPPPPTGSGPGAYPGSQGFATPAPEERRSWFARHKVLTGLLGVAAVLILIVAIGSAGSDDTSETVAGTEQEQSSSGTGGQEDVDVVGESEAEAQPAEEEKSESAAQGSRDNPLPIGGTATVGPYEVTVDAVNTDANQLVLDANTFNEPPEGQYVVVTFTTRFIGDDADDEGNPWVDLAESIVSNNAQYGPGDNSAVAPEPRVMDVPTLEPGGVATWNEVFDIPTLDGAILFVEESFTFGDDSRNYWTVN